MRKTALSDEILMQVEKPARYIGNEVNMTVKDPEKAEIRFCMCFPDVYEIGMSHLGIQILYDMFNRREDTYCERVYSPWVDLENILRERRIPLFALESQRPVREFDFLGITLQYEMCYTNILQILELSQIPLLAAERTEDDPIVIGGGPCACNPEPLADFFDLFYIGEGETVYDRVLDAYKENRRRGGTRRDYLELAAEIEGIYIPAFYDVAYHEDGTLASFEPNNPHAKRRIRRQVENRLSDTFYPTHPLVPHLRAVQDRAVLEIQRGCIRGCRFCQAGMIYRPNRERSLDFLKQRAEELIQNSGYEELSLSSLSSSDYSALPELVYYLIDTLGRQKVNLSLPSLRIDAFSLDVMSRVQDIRKTSLTFAPEAGSQRLRNVINKGLSEEAILAGARSAFASGWNKVKLYFMLGLPTETEDDIEQIAILSDRIAQEYYRIPKQERDGRVSITASTSFFVPKPFTPFQWVRMVTEDEFRQKQRFLSGKMKEQLNRKSLSYRWHDAPLSLLEGVFARGDRRLAPVLLAAYRNGARFDSWSEQFREEAWQTAFDACGVSMEFYNGREREKDELFPWDFIDAGITKEFLWREYNRARQEQVTPNCRNGCAGCGARSFGGGVCFESGNGA